MSILIYRENDRVLSEAFGEGVVISSNFDKRDECFVVIVKFNSCDNTKKMIGSNKLANLTHQNRKCVDSELMYGLHDDFDMNDN